jgi:asparagine synthase (glutamine-hydrolysing)
VCGICGIVHCQADHLVDRDVLCSMRDAMIHRGPEDKWHRVGPGVGLALRHLAICSPSGEKHSASNEDGSIWAVLDGQIYNCVELRAYLTAKGHKLRSPSDVEILTHLYEEKGDGFAKSLTGEFAIALWDGIDRRLILVRDRLGVKSLYMASVDGTLVFASELRAVMHYPGVGRSIDLMAFSEYLTFQHTIAPRTILSKVQKLPAGHLAVHENGGLSVREYWDLRFPEEASKDRDEKLHVERFREGFATALRRRVKDVPVGAFLSGGMDSSSIVAMLSHLGVPEIHTYSGGYRRGDSDGELSHARVVAEHCHTCHFELTFSPEVYRQALPRFILYMDDPVADCASLIRMLLAERARQDGVVILGGEGGDDVTGGYNFDGLKWRFDRLCRFQRLPRWLRCSLPALVSPFLPHSLCEWLARGNRDISTINAEEHTSMVWAFEAEEKRRYCPILHEVEEHCHDLAREVYARSGTADPLSQALYFYTKIWVAENLMMSAGKMTASHSVDYRAPFLDHELVELCARIPSDYKVCREKDGTYTTKGVLRQAMRGILPAATMSLPKSPFTVPTQEWFQSCLADYCRDVLLSDGARASGYYDSEQVEVLLRNYCRCPTERTMLQIRNLLFFEMWRQLVLAH